MPDIARRMTPGELRYAMEVFGADLDYGQILIHNTRTYFFQPGDTAITPNGEVYFPPQSYKADYSTTIADAAWLIHELTHSWQHQKGMWVRLRGMLNRNYAYGDLAGSRMTLAGYGIEQQASIVADCFRVAHGLSPREGQGSLADYARVIPFLPGGRR